MGFQVAFNLGFSMAFVSAFFLIFYIKERVSKAKHLQIVSGVEIVPFWLSALVWDLVFSLLPVAGIIITFIGFQEDGFSTSEQLGKN
jgi:ATP-binding cassette subfamily A (ABC1) protein 3